MFLLIPMMMMLALTLMFLLEVLMLLHMPVLMQAPMQKCRLLSGVVVPVPNDCDQYFDQKIAVTDYNRFSS